LNIVENNLRKLDFSNFTLQINFENDNVIYNENIPIEVSYLHSLLKVSSHIAQVSNKLSEIRKIAEKYSTSDSVESVVLNEISKIEEAKSTIPDSQTLYARILCEKPPKLCLADKRNLIAHGGFEQNVTFLWRCGDDICVSYGDCIENVEKYLG
jgi:Uncharacterized protein predicted to be involved in DNA repair